MYFINININAKIFRTADRKPPIAIGAGCEPN